MANFPKITAGNLDTLREMMEKIISDFSTKDITREDVKQTVLSDLQAGRAGLLCALPLYNENKGYSDPHPPYAGRSYSEPGRHTLITYELHAFNQNGNSYITRVSECLIKTFGLVQGYQGHRPPRYALFRGQPDVKDEITCSIGRKMQQDTDCPEDKVSDFEIKALRCFQSRLGKDGALRQHVFGSGQVWDADDPRWWALKQHYDDDKSTGGTRLIDVTTSPLCGLYFACVNWDGTIDDSDGALWVFVSPPGRRFVDKDSVGTLKKFDEDVDDVAGNDIYEYFRLDRSPDVLKCVLGYNYDQNIRSISQDGLFLFNNRPKEPINHWWGEPPICFAIPGDCKRHIARELYRVGYTPRKIVRGPKGEIAQQELEKLLGF